MSTVLGCGKQKFAWSTPLSVGPPIRRLRTNLDSGSAAISSRTRDSPAVAGIRESRAAVTQNREILVRAELVYGARGNLWLSHDFCKDEWPIKMVCMSCSVEVKQRKKFKFNINNKNLSSLILSSGIIIPKCPNRLDLA